jgi:hypothetical protein
MKEKTKKTAGKHVPSSLLIRIFFLFLIGIISYGIGMGLGMTAVSGTGFGGAILTLLFGCNRCYQRGYADGQKTSNFGRDIENPKES